MKKVYLVTNDIEVGYGVDMEVEGVFSTRDMASDFIRTKGYQFNYYITPMLIDCPETDNENGVYYPSAFYME